MVFVQKSIIKGILLSSLVIISGITLGIILNGNYKHVTSVPTEEQVSLDPFMWPNSSQPIYPYYINGYIGPNLTLGKFHDNLYVFELFDSGNDTWNLIGDSIDDIKDGAAVVRKQDWYYNTTSMEYYGNNLSRALHSLTDYEILMEVDNDAEHQEDPFRDKLALYRKEHGLNHSILDIINNDASSFRIYIFPDAIFYAASYMYYEYENQYQPIDDFYIKWKYEKARAFWDRYLLEEDYQPGDDYEILPDTYHNYSVNYFIDLTNDYSGWNSLLFQTINQTTSMHI